MNGYHNRTFQPPPLPAAQLVDPSLIGSASSSLSSKILDPIFAKAFFFLPRCLQYCRASTKPHPILQTRCPGSKKFATPSLTAYSCPHAPHTSLPSDMHVSISTLCKSLAVCDGSCSSSVFSSLLDAGPSTRSAGAGALAGRSGRPSCCALH